ncbi:MAG TPA: HAMP domain-containing sensor histidine kinase [Polyangiaceae bacterium]|nr:HAMP domain-containing sensor histidine kinase [Polyangiaceae bacterium]
MSKRLSTLLAATFGLTIASFLFARAVSEQQARGISDAATTISEWTLPSNDLLAPVRPELTRISSTLTEIEDRPPKAQAAQIRKQFDDARKAIDASWRAYLELPVFPGERDVERKAEADMFEMHGSIDRVASYLAVGAREDALREAATAQPLITRVDDDVQAIAATNRQIAMDAADRIGALRKASREWGLFLDALSVCFALACAYFVTRVVSRSWSQSAERAAELEHFAGRVAHDIRSPLGTISLALELAKRRSSADPQTQSLLDRGGRTLKRVGQLVDGMLVFATAEKPSAGNRGANVREVIQGVIEDVRPDAEAKEIALDADLPETDVLVACSPGVLVSLVSNLVVNAIKYMGDAPIREVAIRLRDSPNAVRVEIADTGPGVDARLQASIFDPHVRGANVTASGFGLGLATVRRLAEAHGGTVGLRDHPHGGSIFWFELPKWKPSDRHAGGAPRTEAAFARRTAKPA